MLRLGAALSYSVLGEDDAQTVPAGGIADPRSATPGSDENTVVAMLIFKETGAKELVSG